MNKALDEHLTTSDAKSSTKRLKIAIPIIVIELIVGVFYHRAMWGIDKMWDILYYVALSAIQALIVSGLVLIVSGIINFLFKRKINVFRNMKLYINSLIIGSSIWIIIMLAVIVITIVYQ